MKGNNYQSVEGSVEEKKHHIETMNAPSYLQGNSQQTHKEYKNKYFNQISNFQMFHE